MTRANESITFEVREAKYFLTKKYIIETTAWVALI